MLIADHEACDVQVSPALTTEGLLVGRALWNEICRNPQLMLSFMHHHMGCTLFPLLVAHKYDCK